MTLPRARDAAPRPDLRDDLAARLARLAARATGAPLAAIVMRDEGHDLIGTAGDVAEPALGVCREVAALGRPSLVSAAPAHVAVPLVAANGAVAGAVCAIDREARAWDDDAIAALEDLAATALGQLELRREARARRRLADELRASEDSQQGVLDDIRDVVFQTDLDGHWTFLNPAWATITGYAVEESIGRSALEFVHPDDRDWVGEKTTPMLMGRSESAEYHHRWTTAGGEERWCSVRAHAMMDPHGLVAGMAGVMSDITEQMRVLEAQRDAERLKSEFFALVSHELRTPLTSIAGYLELLLDDEERAALGDDGQKAFLETMQRNASRLERLVGDLLFVAQLEAGQMALEPRDDVDLATIAADAVAGAELRGSKRHVAVTLAVDAAPRMHADGDRLAQLVDNLLANALKWTPAGGTIAVRLAAAADGVLLEVSDSGCGIPEAELAHVFDRFYRGSAATTREAPGAGLGLSICKAIVEGHGGEIALASSEGAGTTVTVALPLPAAAGR